MRQKKKKKREGKKRKKKRRRGRGRGRRRRSNTTKTTSRRRWQKLQRGEAFTLSKHDFFASERYSFPTVPIPDDYWILFVTRKYSLGTVYVIFSLFPLFPAELTREKWRYRCCCSFYKLRSLLVRFLNCFSIISYRFLTRAWLNFYRGISFRLPATRKRERNTINFIKEYYRENYKLQNLDINLK